uniref:CDP-diacylglycerol--glycerol-3-phosphate 3-phosphatidyltransferase n=1 Tax=Caenorhabditis japonica TaxID=281687 RepID=A0A8R1E7W2_CAEJA
MDAESLAPNIPEMPGIPIDGANIEILNTPTDFYEKLLELTLAAEHRITLSSLYLGEGDLEKKLVSTIGERLDRGKIDVTVLLDYLRGTRRTKDGESSLTVLEPISERAKEVSEISIYDGKRIRE